MDPETEEFHIYMWDDEEEEEEEIVEDSVVPNECACCGKAASLICSRCKRVKYCSKECQKKDWGPSHKAVCHVPSIVYFKKDCTAMVKGFKDIKDESFRERYFVEDGLECSECHVIQDYFNFSKSQVVKDSLRRCKECVASTAPPPPKISDLFCNGCQVEKQSTEFSKSQRANKFSKRRCMECVDAAMAEKEAQPVWYEGKEHIFETQ